MAISYTDSGVDVERGYKAVELMKKHIARTTNARKSRINITGNFTSIRPRATVLR